jgi:hypothetical protein
VGNWHKLQVFDIRMALPREMSVMRFNLRDQANRAGHVLERAVHDKLREFDLGLMGEWFDISVKDALAVIQKVSETSTVRCVSIEHLASVLPDHRLDPEVTRSHRLLLKQMLDIKAVAAAKSGVRLDKR